MIQQQWTTPTMSPQLNNMPPQWHYLTPTATIPIQRSHPNVNYTQQQIHLTILPHTLDSKHYHTRKVSPHTTIPYRMTPQCPCHNITAAMPQRCHHNAAVTILPSQCCHHKSKTCLNTITTPLQCCNCKNKTRYLLTWQDKNPSELINFECC